MTASAENTSSASLDDKVRFNRYEQIRDLLRYTFKMPSPYGSSRERVKIKTTDRFDRRVRIYPVAYHGMFGFSTFGSMMHVSGGVRPFLWMTENGDLVVITSSGSFRGIKVLDLVRECTEEDYELLVLWLSNDANGALRRIQEFQDADEERTLSTLL
jgi:hypothetical protein